MLQQSNSHTSNGLVLFGGGGDLSLRMLFPALAYLESENLLSPALPVIATQRTAMDEAAFRAMVRETLEARAPETVTSGAVDRLLARMRYIALDITKTEAM